MSEANILSESFRRMSDTLNHNTKVLQSSIQTIKHLKSNEALISASTHVVREDQVTVEMKCAFLKIVDIHTVNQVFRADMFVTAKWEDPAFSKMDGKKMPKFDPKIHWAPKLMILNSENLTMDRKSYIVRHQKGNKHPVVILLWRFKGMFRENMELKYFPFDVQDLTIQVSTERSISSVQLIEDLHSVSTVNTHTFDDAQEWSIYRHVETVQSRTSVEHASLSTHPILNFKSRVKRKVGYFMWNVALIMFLITILTFTAVGVEPSNGDRIAISIMLFLTAVAFKLVVKQDLPTISYLTFLDVYILVLVVFLTVQSAENSCMCALGRHMKIEKLRTLDHWLQVGLGAFLFLFHVVFVFYIQFTALRKRRRMVEKDRQYQQKREHLENPTYEKDKRKNYP